MVRILYMRKQWGVMMLPELLTTTQAAEYLGVTRQHTHALTKQGYGTRYGSVWMFTRAELDAWRAQPKKGPGGRPPKAEAGQLMPAMPA
jgi:excisionase family DNA binding protein